MTTPDPLELPTQYEPAATEPAIYQGWLDAAAFTARPDRTPALGGDRPPFTIVIPPPNVTAILHTGHGLNNTVQDVIVRWRRMAGDEALWVPGTDHAGIATQNVVEKLVAAEGKTRFDIGREAFVARVHAFVEETGGVILDQLRAIGSSCDWTRTAYTLTPELSRAVREAFVLLYERGLVYRGHRVIHWCPRCLTSLSDEEAEHHDETGKLYHIAYPVSGDPSRSITVATTRPETMLGDVAVAVHPEDERYRDLVGRTVRLPIAEIDIPVIADAYTDPAFGTGAVKITPAHDPNDFEVGLRHALAMPVVITPTGEMAEVADAAGRVPAALRGLDRFEARRRIEAMLREQGRLEKVETHAHAVRHCYRCDTVVEPRLSDQWFVRMAPLAAPALEAVRSGRVRIMPERWVAVYHNWMENIRDWNISRQLWWGHRIPVWYCAACPAPHDVVVSRDDVAACPRCGGPVRQDEDVLDTWFSSWLWPISTLGWPDREARDLKAFYPTDHLVTAPEILFFWVARMIMAGYAFMDDAPFHTVYLHGTVRDTQHRKMSKSLGNGIDPLDVVRLYGADALRWTLVSGLGMGADLILDPDDLEKSFAPGRNFATKLWNIARFLLGNVGDAPVTPVDALRPQSLTRADRWILARLDAAIAEVDGALGPARPWTDAADRSSATWPEPQRAAGLRLNEYAEVARRFVWDELAAWYLESVKARLAQPGEDREVARAVLVHAFDAALRLLHPIVPFITEGLWQRLPGRLEGEQLVTAAWPRPSSATVEQTGEHVILKPVGMAMNVSIGQPGVAVTEFDLAREAVEAIRRVRADYAIPPGKEVAALLVPATDAARRVLDEERPVIGRLARASLAIADRPPTEAAAHILLADGSEVAVPLAGVIDLDKECARLRTELSQLDRQLAALTQRLGNEGFTSRAPAAVVEAERRKHEEWTARRGQLAGKVEALCGA